MNKLSKILFAELIVDNNARTFEVGDAVFGTRIVDTYAKIKYGLRKGYTQIGD